MFRVGDYVKNTINNIYGKVIRIIVKNKKIQYLVKLDNNILATFNENELVKIDRKTQNKNQYLSLNTNQNISFNLIKDKEFTPEIMLRHQTLEEALNNLEYFIDKAIANNVKEIRIIHGRSGGILRKGIQRFLETHPNIAEFRLGYYYEGSYGVTVARLK